MTRQFFTRIILLIQILFFHTVVFAANSYDVNCNKRDSAQLVLKGDAATQWISEHLDSFARS